jgi:ferredoxin
MCELTAPSVYELDDDGVVRLVADPVPEALTASAVAGARVCPVAALRIES